MGGWVVGEQLEIENLDGYIEKLTWGAKLLGQGRSWGREA
jgi:hypothetical protein